MGQHKNNFSAPGDARRQQPHTLADLSEGEEGSHLAKRRRVSRACDQCRHSKLRCNGGSPECSKCLHTNKVCSYSAAAKRRGLKTGYVRTLECLWGLVFQRIQGSEAAVDSLLSRTSAQDLQVRDHIGDSASVAEGLLISWKASKIPEKIHQLLATIEDPEDETNIDPEADMPVIVDQHPTISWTSPVQQASEQTPCVPDGSSDFVGQESVEMLQNTRVVKEMQTTIANNDTSAVLDKSIPAPLLELPHGSSGLLDCYFRYTNSWLPIVERHVVFRTMYSYPIAGCSVTRRSPDSGEHAVLWAMLACASAETPKTATVTARLAEPSSTCELMYANARSLIPWENEHELSVGHVQALTILALYRWNTHDYKASWLAISHAISIAFAINLDQHAKAGQYQRDIAERVWLGCFVMESLLAMRIKREPSLRPQDVEPCLPMDESGLEEWEPWRASNSGSDALHYQGGNKTLPTRALSTFNQLVRLTCIANRFLRTYPCTSRMELAASLEAWKGGLPKHCIYATLSSNCENPAPVPSPNIVNLNFVYLSLALQLSIDSTNNQGRYSSLQVEPQTLSECADSLSQFYDSGKLCKLPPSLEILATAASTAADPPILSRRTALRQLRQDLTRISLGSSIEKWPLASTNLDGYREHAPVTRDNVLQSDAINADSEGINPRKVNPPSACELGNDAHPSRKRHQEDTMINTKTHYDNLSLVLDAPHDSHALVLPQELAHQMTANNGASTGLAQRENNDANLATAFLSADAMTTMTDTDSFLDYFELFDGLEIQNQTTFMKALGYTI